VQIEIADQADFGPRAADLVIDAIARKPEAVVGLPTGRTPLPLYAELRRGISAGKVDLSAARFFAIDELHGVPSDHPATNASYFARELPGLAVAVMDSSAPDGDAECGRFVAQIERAGDLDLAIVGIGVNGHLAFNEPGSPFDSAARRVRLERPTREAYADAFGSFDATPAYGLTLGMSDLLSARQILLLASGAAKAAIVARALEGPVTIDIPASALQQHANVIVLLDREASADLSVSP
jgi:glucosamine-6-phosphate deaminase